LVEPVVMLRDYTAHSSALTLPGVTVTGDSAGAAGPEVRGNGIAAVLVPP